MAAFGIPAVDLPAGASEAVGAIVPVAALLEIGAPTFRAEPPLAVAAPTGVASTVAPHLVQNFVPADKVVPHVVQNRPAATVSAVLLLGAAHLVQKASHSVSAAPHCLQFKFIACLRSLLLSTRINIGLAESEFCLVEVDTGGLRLER